MRGDDMSVEDRDPQDRKLDTKDSGADRRDFLKLTLATGVGAASAVAGITQVRGANAADVEHKTPHVPPGELDDYYGLWSGGQSGEVRILGLPSMRVLKRIPVFNKDAAYGWGTTNFSKKLLKGKDSGDTHHAHMSYSNGTYDGKYAFVNDKAQARLARIRLDYMEVDKITQLPHCQGTHGIFPSRNKIDGVYCNSEYRIPIPNDGRDLENPEKYVALHTCVDAESMEVRWQVMVDGNLDLCATDYDGRYSMACNYNSEEGVVIGEMMAADRDYLTVFNLAEIEKAVKAGKGTTIGDSKIPVLDGRGEKNPYTLYIPVPKSPHGVNVDPTGKYAICSGKLSPTCSVVAIDKIADAFAGKIKPRDCVLAEPEVGLGPLHTAFDNRGNAYTSIFIDSVVTKWNIAKAIAGENPVIQKLDINYQVGHINASMSETKEADGQWVISLNKFSKDRFLPVGPFHAENEQLIDISGSEMKLVHDGAAHPEPHDALIVRRDIMRPRKIWDPDDEKFALEHALAKEAGVAVGDTKVVRNGNKVTAVMISVAPAFSLTEIHAKQGDEVTVIISNRDNVEDLCHGFCVSHHDVNVGVAPQETVSVTFEVPNKGVFWYYCPWFCHALHLEMRGRLIVS
jgi:nitrous-oxide reductase